MTDSIMDHSHHVQEGSFYSSANDNPTFCNLMNDKGMSMYMTGFHWTLSPANTYSETTNLPCLNLLSPQWTLDNEFKFLLGMISVICLGLCLECVAFFKVWVVMMIKKRRASGNEFGFDILNHVRYQRLCLSFLHGFQALIGYLLMLAAMTYSIELLLSAILGLVIGNSISTNVMAKFQDTTRRNDDEATADDEVGFVPASSPCCEFVEDANLTTALLKDE